MKKKFLIAIIIVLTLIVFVTLPEFIQSTYVSFMQAPIEQKIEVARAYYNEYGVIPIGLDEMSTYASKNNIKFDSKRYDSIKCSLTNDTVSMFFMESGGKSGLLSFPLNE